jgi:hypothetical protein
MADILSPADLVVYPDVLNNDGAFEKIELIEKIADPEKNFGLEKASKKRTE